MKNANELISEIILNKLKALKLTRKDLSESIGLDKLKLDNYLQNKAKWDVEYVRRIFFSFNISFDKLLIPQRTNIYTLKKWHENEFNDIAAEGNVEYKKSK